MTKEYKISGNAVKISEIPCQPDGIVIGDECCIHKILNFNWKDIVVQLEQSGYMIRFVTPFVPEKYMDDLYTLLFRLCKIKKFKVTFNDFGFLYKCRKLAESGKITPVMGRVITRSIIDCPWHENILAYEDLSLKNAVTGYSAIHNIKWEVFKQYGACEAELNFAMTEATDYFKNKGVYITCYADNLLVSIGRHCYSARWYGLDQKNCWNQPECQNKLSISLDKKWGKMKLMYESANEEDKLLYEKLYVVGNAVYKSFKAVINCGNGLLFDSVIYSDYV